MSNRALVLNSQALFIDNDDDHQNGSICIRFFAVDQVGEEMQTDSEWHGRINSSTRNGLI